MKQFKPSLLTLALATTGLVSGYSYAAEEGADTEVEEVIKVTGIRGSLMRAQAVKMDSTSVVEVISAEDIGKLPDSSIAESLARLPGMAGERRDGRTSGISVRGFREDYSGSTMNGRELLGMGDNRGVEFDLYPSEIMSGVTVYKAPEAKLTTQGVAGTVDLQTIRPLASDEFVSINYNLEQNGMKSENPDFDDQGHRLAVGFSQKFADDKVGLALTYASTESPSQEQHFRGWGYANVGTAKKEDGEYVRDDDGNLVEDYLYDPINNPDGTIVLENGLTRADVEDALITGGHDSYQRSAMLERDAVAGVLQLKPTDDLTVTLDALYIDFKDSQIKRGMEDGGAEWGVGKNYTISEVKDGFVTKGKLMGADEDDGFRSVVRNDAYEKTAELTAYAANVEYQINDNWKAELDFSTNEVDKTITDVESYAGVGRAGHKGQGAGAVYAWEQTATGVMYSEVAGITNFDLSDASKVKLAGPQSWGGGMSGLDSQFAGTSDTSPHTTLAKNPDSPIGFAQAQDGFVNQPVFKEKLDALALDLEGYVEIGPITKIKSGVRFSDRSKSKDNRGFYLTASSYPDHQVVPSQYVVGVTDMSFIGVSDVVAYDSLSLYRAGEYTASDAADLQPSRKGDTYIVEEELLQAYVQADIEAELGDVWLRGNFGVQYVDTTQKSDGFFSQIGANGLVDAQATSEEESYSDILPSLNLNFEVADDMLVRVGLAKTQSRPRIDDMRVSGEVSFDFNPGKIVATELKNSPWSASGGNPFLKPLEANQFDLAYDWYFAEDGYLSAAFFYKDLTNWHYESSLVRDFSDAYIESYHQLPDGEGGILKPTLFQGVATAKLDGLEGFVRGYEFQATVPFNLVSDALDGFGAIFAYANSDGALDKFEGQEVDPLRIPGLSKETYSLITFYEAGGFQIRVAGTKRSDFLTETRGDSLSLVPATDTGSTLWDAQIGFDFGKAGIDALDGLTVSLQAQNITDEEQIQFANGDPRQVTKYQIYGANYLLGVNYKF
ncbi:TonB-dependent receptor [Catenovulum agarivorans DS-2]|uniref:TonB-dependent receptor n=1 Tax=Catenovulum agarivorans DS-2 TaxID=1328313 RepID=W7QV08_9ALTE|nr:TonB-dependent receptor [Catenovulum agarivorans]EWH09115.1 TonB-dependent receptor [Catenovulum agarivorans DS-2]